MCGCLAFAASGTARASNVGHCAESQAAQAASLCADYEAAPRLVATDPMGQQALRVWARVADPVAALSERHTGIVLMGPSAQMHDGRRFPPAAYICPGAPPVVYVPYDLIVGVFGPKATYTNDFLAFVLGHELGHRLNDYSLDGCEVAAFARGGVGVDQGRQERLADFRGAFFAAIAGYDARTLANTQTVTAFLKREFKLRPSELGERAKALTDALAAFGTYEDIYQAALAVLFLGERPTASRLLGWLDERVAGQGVPLPELALVHGLALLQEAAPEAPWLDRLGRLPAPSGLLACQSVFPTHSALWEDPSAGRVRASGGARRAAERNIAEARRLLRKADEMGASPLAVASGLACAAFLAGEPGEALRQLERARKRSALGRGAASTVQDSLSANESLIRFALWLDANAPVAKADSGFRAWREGLLAARTGFAQHPALGRYIDRLVGLKSASNEAASVARPTRCGLALPSFPPLSPTPAMHGATSLCPAGFAAQTLMPAPSASFVVCAATAGPGRIVRVVLPSLSEPVAGAADLTIALVGRPSDARAELDTWACGCSALEARGASDTGEAAYLGTCPALGAPLAVVVADAKGHVRRVAVVAGP